MTDDLEAAYVRGYLEGTGDLGLTYDDDPDSPRSDAYGRTARRIVEGLER